MAKITVTINGPLMDGQRVVFKAPCDCTEVDYLKVLYVSDGTQSSKLFTMKDAQGNVLTGLGNLFAENSYVHAILDTNNNFAYLQNGNNNKYIDDKFKEVEQSVASLQAFTEKIVSLTGTVEVTTGDKGICKTNIDYPTGANKDNCVVIGAMIKGFGATVYKQGLIDVDYPFVTNPGITLASDEIWLHVWGEPSTTYTVSYKIVLLLES